MDKESWSRLNNAIAHYESLDFLYRDVPWIIDKEPSDLTKPSRCKDFYVNDKVLVGSAEQSFLSIYEDDWFDYGLYYAITPCFRDEEKLDDLHRQYFMKLELFTKNVDKFPLIFNAAYKFFLNEVEDIGALTTCEVDDGLDIFYKGVEIGSYYKRQVGDKVWACGTGLAEPRFTYATEL